MSLPIQHLHIILLAHWRLINVSPHLPLELRWPVEPLSALCAAPHPDPGVLWLALNCYAIHMGLNEPGRVQLEEKLLEKGVFTSIYSPFDETLEGRVLPYIEMRRANKYLSVTPEDHAPMFAEECCIDPSWLRLIICRSFSSYCLTTLLQSEDCIFSRYPTPQVFRQRCPKYTPRCDIINTRRSAQTGISSHLPTAYPPFCTSILWENSHHRSCRCPSAPRLTNSDCSHPPCRYLDRRAISFGLSCGIPH